MRNIESKVNSSHRYIVNNEVLMLQVNLAGENVWKRFQYATCINDRGGVVVREFGSHSVDSLFILLFSNINALKMVLTDLLVGAQQRQQSGGVNLLSPCWRHNNSSSYLQSFRPVVPNPRATDRYRSVGYLVSGLTGNDNYTLLLLYSFCNIEG